MATALAPVSIPRRCRAAVLTTLDELGGEGSRHEILARAKRIAGFTPEELRMPAPEKHRDKHALLVDYHLSWTLTNLKREGYLENPRWSYWQLAGTEAQRAVAPRAATAGVPEPRLRQLRAMEYQEYLRTPEWQRTREAALLRAEHRCQLSADHADGLDVHHSSYERVGAELTSDLVVLCHPCHTRHHAPPPVASMSPPATKRQGRSLWTRMRRAVG